MALSIHSQLYEDALQKVKTSEWNAKLKYDLRRKNAKQNVNCNIRNVPNCYSNQNYWAMSKSQLHEFTVWGCVAKGPKYNYPNTNTNIAKGTTDPGVDCFDQ